ncbi:universal stress protein [Nonomuraea sp. NBC_00507]|uniref:universal stress protein n=1 Tax=Nonomuraea sp. NBC_00507 TaxID=2976002 RepID=UPI002E16D31A
MDANGDCPHSINNAGPRVLVALDGSLASLAALRYAVDEARRREACLHAIRVLPGAGALPGLDDGDEFFSLLRKGAWISFREALGYVPTDVEVSVLVARGEPGPALVDLADREDDLLVLGRGDVGLLGRWRGTATSCYCVAHGRCPVLIVPLPAHLRSLYRSRVRRRDLDRLLHG